METPDMPGLENNEPTNEAVTEVTPEAEASIGEKLAAISDAHDGLEAPVDTDTAEGTTEQADETVEEPSDNEDDSTELPESEEPTEEQPSGDATPTLPAAQVRSLKSYGWSDDEIASAMGTPNFEATAARIHQNRTQEIQAYANQGRANKAAQEQQDGQTQSGQTVVPQQFDIDGLKEKYGSEDLIDEVIVPFNALLAQIHAVMPDLHASQQVAETARMEAARDSVDSFFTTDSMKPYGSAYGESSEKMSEDQRENRIKLLQITDDIRSGASLRNQDLTIHEAMAYAHEIVGGDFKTEAIRSEIAGKVKKRGGGISLKPGTNTTSEPATGGALSQQQIEKNARERLDALGA